MKHDELLRKQYDVLSKVNSIPRKMVPLHGIENMTEFVLHELCHEKCFNFNKAAFVVENHDFDCLKGVAGFNRQEAHQHPDIWQSSDAFSSHMQQSPFNQKVRNIMRSSLKKEASSAHEAAAMIADELGIKNHQFCAWPMKYDNHGLLVFEKPVDHVELSEDDLLNGLSILSFCPIF